MSFITTLEHAFAVGAQKIVSEAKMITEKVLPVLKKVASSEKTIEDITAIIDPNAVNIERAAFAGLGVIIKAIEDAGAAAGENGLNVQLDAALIADIKAIIPAIKASAPPVTS
jgi:hypothetical protein